MKKLIAVILLCLLISGCKKHPDSFSSVDEIKDQVDLKLEFKTEKIGINGVEVDASVIDRILARNDKELVLVNYANKFAYLSDLNFKVTKKISFGTKYEKQFTQRIFNAFINKDTLFIADGSMSIKKINLATEEVKVIPLNGMSYFNQPFQISFLENGNYLYTFSCFKNVIKDKIKTGDYVMGTIFNSKGIAVDYLTAKEDLFNHELIARDKAFYTIAGNNHYLHFEMEKNVLITDQKSGQTAQKSLYVNKDWSKPKLKEKQISAYIMSAQNMAKHNDKLIHWPPPGNFEPKGRVVVYDQNLNPIKKAYMHELAAAAFYFYTVCGDKLIIYSARNNTDKNFYVYSLKGL